MHILVVGNVIKDVYLRLDPRTESFEQDANNISWLDLSFDASSHHFFRRNSSFGGAAITMEVLGKIGLNTTIAGSDFHYDDTGAVPMNPITTYRYILTSDNGTTYFTSSTPEKTIFTTPSEQVDYLYIDRSANLTPSAIDRINAYLDFSHNTKLILYVKDAYDTTLTSIIRHADLIFLEHNRGKSAKSSALPSSQPPHSIIANFDKNKIISLSEDTLSYLNITEHISPSRIDTMTHLSVFSILSATILGGFVLGKTVEYSLKMARINVENATLDSTLSIAELENLASSAREDNLELIARNLVAPGKGILAADESGGSIEKKFAELSITDSFANRHAYRDIFLSSPNLQNYLNGVILFDETARDHDNSGRSYIDLLTAKRIIPGIKVDQGLAPLDNSDETYTKGLDTLKSRLQEYYQMGLRFAKWRAAFNLTLSPSGEIITPSIHAIEENCRILAEYAKECQLAGLVPIVEPEVVYNGDYPIEKNAEATGRILDELFHALNEADVNLRACLLKCNMVLAGKKYKEGSTPDEVGHFTADVLKSHVPNDLAGIVFLSGGQTPEQATANLAAIIDNGPFPWPLTFSFARALQDPALNAWVGQPENLSFARDAFLARLKANAEALS